jgi:pimeloyl-ACP methyl ester carboxylesterase
MTEFATTPDGRQLEVLTGGDPEGFPFLYISGTPSAAVRFDQLWEAADRAGLHLLTYSRPGYGRSTPWPEGADPDMTDDARDALSVLDHFGLGDYVTLGWSGGGPRALACAAEHTSRCLAAISFAGVAPYGVPGLDWFAGMGPENVEGFQLAARGRESYRAQAEADAAAFGRVTGEEIAASLGGLVDEIDTAALTGEFAEYVAESFRHAFHQGSPGYLEDNLQEARDWGFDLAGITTPVSVWQGAHDRMVPFGHGHWLADALPGARRHLFDDEGHLSLVNRLDEMLAELRELAGLDPV